MVPCLRSARRDRSRRAAGGVNAAPSHARASAWNRLQIRGRQTSIRCASISYGILPSRQPMSSRADRNIGVPSGSLRWTGRWRACADRIVVWRSRDSRPVVLCPGHPAAGQVAFIGGNLAGARGNGTSPVRLRVPPNALGSRTALWRCDVQGCSPSNPPMSQFWRRPPTLASSCAGPPRWSARSRPRIASELTSSARVPSSGC